MTFTKGEKEQVKSIEDRLSAIEKQIITVKGIVRGIAFGLIVSGSLFGVVSWKSILKFLAGLAT